MTLKGKNEIKVKSTTNGRETENIFSSKKSYELVLKHSQKLKSFSSKEEAEVDLSINAITKDSLISLLNENK